MVRRAGRDLPYSQFFWAFGLFIISCGGTHFMEVLTVWKPVYWLSAAVKIVTAAASAGTAVVLLIAADDIVEFVVTARQAAASGYAEGLPEMPLPANSAFLQKPFRFATLLEQLKLVQRKT